MPLAMLLSAQLVVAGLLLLLCGFPFCVAAASSRLLQKYGRIAQGLELPFKPERNPRATERGVVLGASCFRAACVTGTFPALVPACSAACHGRNCPTPCSCSQPSASSGLLPRSCPKARPFAPPASLAGECGSPAITCSKLRSHTPAAPTAPQIPSARACACVTPPPPPPSGRRRPVLRSISRPSLFFNVQIQSHAMRRRQQRGHHSPQPSIRLCRRIQVQAFDGPSKLCRLHLSLGLHVVVAYGVWAWAWVTGHVRVSERVGGVGAVRDACFVIH